MRLATPTFGLVLALSLAGCSAESGDAAQSAPARADTESATASEQLPLSGDLVSQGTRTTGTVTLTAATDTEFTLTLSGFSTGPGDDLRLQLSPGELVKGADGYYSINDNTRIELEGAVDPQAPEQTFSVPMMVLDTWQVRSFTVYDYANRTALGFAALTGE